MSTQLTNPPPITERASTSSLAVGRTGNISFSNVAEIVEVARLMSKSQTAVPKHLRENPGACLGVALQASEWEMSPFAVANKSYVVNDRIAYEAQMINAVILRRAPIKGRFKISYSGEGDNRKCKVSAALTDGDTVEYESPALCKIPVKNSPLWKGDPDQQLFYYSSRAMCRRHFPDVILGVYSPDEMELETERDITPSREVPKFIPESAAPIQTTAEQPEQDVLDAAESPATPQDAPSPTPAPDAPASCLQDVKDAMESDGVRSSEVVAFLFANKKVASDKIALKSCPEEALEYALENWQMVKDSLVK